MKRFLTVLFAVLLFIPAVVFADGNNKVKVYIFEAGGCPYCELETEYLKGLSSYNVKFEIVSKELYVDHVNWEEGKDYNLGVKVATAFNEAGFEDAAYTGTPFVVISDIYAVAGYSDDLESIIDEAYDEGDKDAVSCIAAGDSDCIRAINTNTLSSSVSNSMNSKSGLVIAILAGVCLVGAIVYIFKNKDNNTNDEEDEKVEEVTKEKTPVKTESKKTNTVKKTTSKKPISKKTTSKTQSKKPVKKTDK